MNIFDLIKRGALNMSDVDIKNVTIVSKLRGFVLVKEDVQVHNSNEKHADTEMKSD